MQISRHILHIDSLKGSVVTMGKFDGMHLGHQVILNNLKKRSRQSGLPSVVILFEPHPAGFFQPNIKLTRLMRFRQKLLYLKNVAQIDKVVCLRFNSVISHMSAEDFISQVFFEKLHARYIVAGEDFCFGYKRLGNIAILKQYAEQYHYEVDVMQLSQHKALQISSTQVRQLLADGDMAGAKALLGDYYQIEGRVIHGNKLGRHLGFPTANISCAKQVMPLEGIFVAKVKIEDDKHDYYGVAHLGPRAVVDDTAVVLEVNIFQFDRDIYGKNITVSFLHKLRDTTEMDNLDDLKDKISQDVCNANSWLQAHIV